MQIRPVDSIYRPIKEKQKKPEIQPKAVSKIKKPVSRLWFWVLLGILAVLAILFWQGLLGPKLDLMRVFLGLDGKYLVLFQNNTEIRPSGGFIGSFAEVQVNHGLVKNYQFETNIYKRDKEFIAQKCIPSPAPAQKIWPGGCMNMANSNLSPDFQKSAEDVEWFYKQEGGNSVDGVIALDTNLFTDLLKVIGPIEMPEYNLTLTSDNFVKETQYYVEKKYWEEAENWEINEPKTILKDALPKVLARVQNPKYAYKILKMIVKNAKEKHLLFYFKNPGLSKIVSKNNWDGKVRNSQGDYLYINNANLGGLKSSLNVKQNINLQSQIQNDGSVLNTLTITRNHQGDGQWPDAINQNYTQVLLPKGSILQTKNGIEDIDFKEDSGKTVLGFWTTVVPKESKKFEIKYILPFKLTSAKKYQILIQKQPGTVDDTVDFSLQNGSKWKWSGVLNEDKIIEIDLTKE